MNLTSCDICGVVLDKDKLDFPEVEYNEDGLNTDTAIWDGEDFVAFVYCPICKNQILENQ